MNVRLFPCTCSNIFQDDTYGQDQRVHILGSLGWHCTTCGMLVPLEGSDRSDVGSQTRSGVAVSR